MLSKSSMLRVAAFTVPFFDDFRLSASWGTGFEFVACLRTGRALRVPRARAQARGKKFVTAEIMISQRPAEADDRAVPGHWEGDLILGVESSAIGTLVERTTVRHVRAPQGSQPGSEPAEGEQLQARPAPLRIRTPNSCAEARLNRSFLTLPVCPLYAVNGHMMPNGYDTPALSNHRAAEYWRARERATSLVVIEPGCAHQPDG